MLRLLRLDVGGGNYFFDFVVGLMSWRMRNCRADAADGVDCRRGRGKYGYEPVRLTSTSLASSTQMIDWSRRVAAILSFFFGDVAAGAESYFL